MRSVDEKATRNTVPLVCRGKEGRGGREGREGGEGGREGGSEGEREHFANQSQLSMRENFCCD